MDIQLINCAESAAYYVCAYLCKAEPEDLRAALADVIENFSQSPDSVPLKTQLLRIGNCVLKTRRLSAQDAAYRICKLPLIMSTRTTVYVNVRPPAKRYRMLKPKSERLELDPTSTDIFKSNILDYYRARPNSHEGISLYEFASLYLKCYPPKASTGHGRSPMERIKLKSPLVF